MAAGDKARSDTQGRQEGKCPNCGRQRVAQFHPFCSRRCADVDLHRWLSGSYVIPGREDNGEPEPFDEDALPPKR